MKLRVSLFALSLLTAASLSAAPIVYSATLSGLNESPSNGSPATGSAIVTMDTVAHTLQVQLWFSGLTAPNTAAHIHCCTAVPMTGTIGVATTTPTFTGFPAGTMSGSYDYTFDTSLTPSFSAAFITANGGTAAGAEAALAAGLASGSAYLNIHTSTFPSGEIRGFLVTVPEPATFALTGIALAAAALLRRRRRA